MLSRLDPVAALDHIGLEADRTWTAVKLEEQATRVAENRAQLITSPQWRC